MVMLAIPLVVSIEAIVALAGMPAPITGMPLARPLTVSSAMILLPWMRPPFITTWGDRVSVPVPVFTSDTAPWLPLPTETELPKTRFT